MAVAFDAATDGGSVTATSLTYAHTVTGSDTFLLVGILGRIGATSLITGVTYAGVAMTYLSGQQLSPSDRFLEAWYLVGPATGANNVVISASGSDYILSACASYTGVNATGQPDNTQQSSAVNVDPGLANTLTTVADNCWHLAAGGLASGNPTAGASTTSRILASGNLALFDNNAAITPAGANTITMTRSLGSDLGAGMEGLSIKPVFVSSIKTVNGLAKASVKTVNGLAIASIKTINSLA